MSGKSSQQSTAIGKQSPSSLVKHEPSATQILIASYFEKFATISNRALTPQVLAVYEEALADMPITRLEAGLKVWFQDGDHWPWPADIRAAGEL